MSGGRDGWGGEAPGRAPRGLRFVAPQLGRPPCYRVRNIFAMLAGVVSPSKAYTALRGVGEEEQEELAVKVTVVCGGVGDL